MTNDRERKIKKANSLKELVEYEKGKLEYNWCNSIAEKNLRRYERELKEIETEMASW